MMVSVSQRRRLIFINLANGVPVEKIAMTFGRSAVQVLDDMRYVSQKIAEYRLKRCMPMIPLRDVGEVMANRVAAFWTLERVDLDVVPKFKKVIVEPADGQSVREFSARRS